MSICADMKKQQPNRECFRPQKYSDHKNLIVILIILKLFKHRTKAISMGNYFSFN